MLICAEDGWVERWNSAEGPETWTFASVSKYKSVRIFCLSEDDCLYVARPEYEFSGPLEKIMAKLFNQRIPAQLVISEAEGKGIDDFKIQLVHAVNSDDDILTQFRDKKVILDNLAQAKTYDQLAKIYKKCGWS